MVLIDEVKRIYLNCWIVLIDGICL